MEVRYERKSCASIPARAAKESGCWSRSQALESRSRRSLEPDLQPRLRIHLDLDELAGIENAGKGPQHSALAGHECLCVDWRVFSAYIRALPGDDWLPPDLVSFGGKATGKVHQGEMGTSLSQTELVMAVAHSVWDPVLLYLSHRRFDHGSGSFVPVIR